MANPINTFGVMKKLIAWGERAEKQGLNLSRDLQPSIDDPEQMMRIVECMVGNTMAAKALSPVYNAAEVSHLFSLGYTRNDILAFGLAPDALPGFLTFFDPGWDLLRLRRFCANKGKIFSKQEWYDDEAFSNGTEKPRYRQLRLEAINSSFNKDFDSQSRLLPENEKVPSARVVVMGMVIHFLLSGQRLFENYHVRCEDKIADDSHGAVGHFGPGGFGVNFYWDDHRFVDLGLASSR